MSRIIVTGANGFIGRHTLPLLVERGWEVHAVDCQPSPLKVPGVVWHIVDLFDGAAVTSVMRKARASHLLSLAWYTKPGLYWSSVENLRWVRGTLDLLEPFRECGGERVVAAGTCAEYDWTHGFCREELTPLAPATVYGRCKNSLRELLAVYGQIHDISVAWCRVFFLYGPHEAAGRLIPSVIDSLLQGREASCTHGRQLRDFLHVRDVASAFVKVAESDMAGAVNIASGEPISLRSIVDRIGTELGRKELIRFGALAAPPGEPPLVAGDNRRLLSCGWEPSIGIEAGIAETISFWKSHNLSSGRCP
jgi:nucleoside-diphosphate-sugar epimerase